MPDVRSFPPVAGRAPRVLILGSMPGEASLRAAQYYAHPRNVFWRIMEEVFSAPDGLSYSGRLAILKKNKAALWDVLGSCSRKGSSDSAIEDASASVNDIPGFLKRHKSIRLVCLNGGKAAEYFRKAVLPHLPGKPQVRCVQLPSTSPAHAGISYAAKLKAWKAALLQPAAR